MSVIFDLFLLSRIVYPIFDLFLISSLTFFSSLSMMFLVISCCHLTQRLVTVGELTKPAFLLPLFSRSNSFSPCPPNLNQPLHSAASSWVIAMRNHSRKHAPLHPTNLLPSRFPVLNGSMIIDTTYQQSINSIRHTSQAVLRPATH